MKKSMIYLLALAAAVMAFSCQRVAEIDVPEETPSQEIDEVLPSNVKMITVSCTLPDSDDSDTKVTLTNDGSKGKVAWEDDDAVLFHGAQVGSSGSDYYSYIATAHDVSADGKTAKFTIPELTPRFNHSNFSWTDAERTTDLYAIYPADLAVDFSNGDYWYFVSAFKSTNHLLLAGVNDTRVDGGYSFSFINLTGALSFKVDSDGTGGFDSYTFSGNNNEVIGYTNYCIKTDRTGDTNDYRTIYTGTDGPGPTSGDIHSITIGSDETPWTGHDGTTINTIYFPNGANFSSGFTIKFFKDGSEVKRVSTNTAKNVAVGKYLDLGDITSRMYTYTPPTPHNNSIGVDVDNAATINLSASATSNCYMIDGSVAANAGASFMFKATKGKGGDAIKGGTANVNIKDVEILWATKNTSVAPTATEIITAVDYNLKDGGDPYIVFKTPDTIVPGNVVIAAKNSSGTILWSWHIWIIQDAMTYTNYDDKLSVTMMGRNLGALVDATANGTNVDKTSLGLFYQWGRKDPFVGGDDLGSSTYAAVYGTAKTQNDGKMSVGYSIQHPTVFGNTSDSKGDWNDSPDNSLWGHGSVKSQYDPCPVGYRVPGRDPIQSFIGAASFTPDMTHYYVKVGTNETQGFAITNYIYRKTGNIYPDDDKPLSYIWTDYRSNDETGTVYVMRIKKDGAVSLTSVQKASGAAVRCVAE